MIHNVLTFGVPVPPGGGYGLPSSGVLLVTGAEISTKGHLEQGKRLTLETQQGYFVSDLHSPWNIDDSVPWGKGERVPMASSSSNYVHA